MEHRPMSKRWRANLDALEGLSSATRRLEMIYSRCLPRHVMIEDLRSRET